MRAKMAYWIGGTLTALLGVALVRLLAPALTGLESTLAVIAGYLLVIVGITVIAQAIGRKGPNPVRKFGKDAPSAGS
jgi:sulfite exporter TauE/SafE